MRSMGAPRQHQHEDTSAQATEPAAATATARPLPGASPAGLSANTLNRSGVIALQRLVGNAAVVEMMQARDRSTMPEAQEAEAAADRPTSQTVATGGADGDLPGSAGGDDGAAAPRGS
jgi:hypothetical protein